MLHVSHYYTSAGRELHVHGYRILRGGHGRTEDDRGTEEVDIRGDAMRSHLLQGGRHRGSSAVAVRIRGRGNGTERQGRVYGTRLNRELLFVGWVGR